VIALRTRVSPTQIYVPSGRTPLGPWRASRDSAAATDYTTVYTSTNTHLGYLLSGTLSHSLTSFFSVEISISLYPRTQARVEPWSAAVLVRIGLPRAQSVAAVVQTQSSPSPSWTYRARSSIYMPGSERISARWKEGRRPIPARIRRAVAKLGFF
jgi:hypothetical protein